MATSSQVSAHRSDYGLLQAARGAHYKRAESVGDITMEAGLDGRSDGRKQPTVMPRVPGVKKLQVPVTEPGVMQFRIRPSSN